MLFRSRRDRHNLDIWPGFVDALATVLMVIIFVLMTFVVAQLYLTDALNGKEAHVSTLERRIKELTAVLSVQNKNNESLKMKASTLDQLVQDLNVKLAHLNNDLSLKDQVLNEHGEHNKSLLNETEALKQQLDRLLKAIILHEETNNSTEKKLNALSQKLNQTLLDRVEESQIVSDRLKQLEAQNTALMQQKDVLETHSHALEADYAALTKETEKNKTFNQIGQYRSEFFSKLLKVLGNRTDIRVVGDRFVFQSEVLFEKASADLGANGKQGLDVLVSALKEIGKTIPNNISWILRIDGHTDRLPIRNPKFPSNWELSSARSIAVVKYLVSKGIPEERLVAAGFGEHQPLAEGVQEQELARNRRIEFKLDQR